MKTRHNDINLISKNFTNILLHLLFFIENKLLGSFVSNVSSFFLLFMLIVNQNWAFAQNDNNSPKSWTNQEVFIWEMLTNGDIADFSEYSNNKKQRPVNEGLREKPIVSKEFIETILFESSYKEKISRQGIRIIGARFIEEINLENATISQPIYFLFCDFERPVCFARAYSEKFLSFKGSQFHENANLDLRRIRTDRSLDLSNINSNEVKLVGASIGGMLDVRGAQVKTKLNMRRIRVSLSLLLRESNDKIQGQFDTVILHDAEIGGDLVISNSFFKSQLDLTSAQINGELRLGSNLHSPAVWGSNARMILRNTSVMSFQDGSEDLKNWPEIDIIGFKYFNLGGLSQTTEESILNRKVKWFQGWLQKQPNYSPQPYRYMAQILSEAGFETKALRIGYLGKNRECKNAWISGNIFHWFNLTFQKIFIGYGYYLMRSLFWIVLLIVIGTSLIKKSEKNRLVKTPLLRRIFYSFDLLIPVIKLDEKHTLANFEGAILYYFYFHKIFGFLMASYVIAGLSGITK